MQAPVLPEGYSLHVYDRIDSTNAEALRLRQAGAADGTVVVASMQTAGRGRRDRRWLSPPGNLYMSVLAGELPGRCPPAGLAFAAALATLDTLADHAPAAPFSLKWPNDVLADGRKIAGILVERAEPGWVVGIGVNLASSPPDVEVSYPATNLRLAAGIRVAADDIAASLCRALDSRWRRLADEGFGPLREGWLASGHRMGDIIAVSDGGATVEGRFAGLEADGSLLLHDSAGGRHVISVGDILFPGGT